MREMSDLRTVMDLFSIRGRYQILKEDHGADTLRKAFDELSYLEETHEVLLSYLSEYTTPVPDLALRISLRARLFDLTGKNIMGPPPRPLQSLTVQIREDEILVSRSI